MASTSSDYLLEEEVRVCNLEEGEDEYVDHGPFHVKIYTKREHVEAVPDPQNHQYPPVEDPPIEEGRPPHVIVVHGPRKVGKSLLVNCLAAHYNNTEDKCLVDRYAVHNRSINDYQYPIKDCTRVRILTGNGRRIQFVECPNNMNGMIDAAKYADAVILVIDAGYGFEMETFEFLELLKVHGMPKVMGVLTHLDTFKDDQIRDDNRQRLLDQFQTRIQKGAQVFCLTSLHNKTYLEHEIAELASSITSMAFPPSSWRSARPYLLVDHFEDVTPQDMIQLDKRCARNIILEGYLRGCHIQEGTKVHIAGVGDFKLAGLSSLDDPFPLASSVSGISEITCMESVCEIRAGAYVSFKLCDVPFEMVNNQNTCQPILVGGITTEEEAVGCVQVKLERNSWHGKLLKSKEPVIVSVGWRRYLTEPIYALEDSKGGYRVLKCTPQVIPCIATFWGPLAPLNANVAVVQSLVGFEATFRILGNASVLGFESKRVNKGYLKDVRQFFNPMLREPFPPDRIWEYGVDDRQNTLSVPADMKSYYKTYIDPLGTEDDELLSWWSGLWGSAEKAAEKQLDKLKIKQSTVSRRRQTSEPLRAVRFFEVIDQQTLTLAELNNLLEMFEKYEKGNQRGAITSAEASEEAHGTTCATFINRVTGLFFGGDGRASTDTEVISDVVDKVVLLGIRILVVICGSRQSCDLILSALRHMEATASASSIWSTKKCAEYVNWFLNARYQDIGLRQEPKECAMTFGAYEGNVPKVFFGSKKDVREIVDGSLHYGVHSEMWSTFHTMGSGSVPARAKIMRSDIDIRNTNLQWEDLTMLMMSGLKDAYEHDLGTGGTSQVYHMLPGGPPRRVHIGPCDRLGLDILQLKIEKLYRLFSEAEDAGDIRAADAYHHQFFQASIGYEKVLKRAQSLYQGYLDMAQPVWETQLQLLEAEERQLIEEEEYLLWAESEDKKRNSEDKKRKRNQAKKILKCIKRQRN